MDFVNYNQKYEKDVLDLWNEVYQFDCINITKFRNQVILDINFDTKLSFVALDKEKVIGFAYGMKRKFPYLERGLEPNKGWVNVIFVKKEYRRQGIGSKLLEAVENVLIEEKTTHIIFGAYSPNYFFYGADKENYPFSDTFLEKKGYKNMGKHYSMGRNLHGFHMSDDIKMKKRLLEKRGYKFIHFNYDYTLDLLDFLKKEFGGGWKRNALIAMQNGIAKEVILMVLNPENEICGFCMSAIDGNPMRFGPIGIAKKERNVGIGSILLEFKMLDMVQNGIYYMYFVTTDESGRRYYERNGLAVIRTFIGYEKNVGDSNESI